MYGSSPILGGGVSKMFVVVWRGCGLVIEGEVGGAGDMMDVHNGYGVIIEDGRNIFRGELVGGI